MWFIYINIITDVNIIFIRVIFFLERETVHFLFSAYPCFQQERDSELHFFSFLSFCQLIKSSEFMISPTGVMTFLFLRIIIR